MRKVSETKIYVQTNNIYRLYTNKKNLVYNLFVILTSHLCVYVQEDVGEFLIPSCYIVQSKIQALDTAISANEFLLYTVIHIYWPMLYIMKHKNQKCSACVFQWCSHVYCAHSVLTRKDPSVPLS